MTYRGHIKNGVAILDPAVTLPEGTPVRVEVDSDDSQFWHGRSLDELARDQGVRPIAELGELVIDWPAEDSMDELLSIIREARR